MKKTVFISIGIALMISLTYLVCVKANAHHPDGEPSESAMKSTSKLAMVDTFESNGPRFAEFYEHLEWTILNKEQPNNHFDQLQVTPEWIVGADFEIERRIYIYKRSGASHAIIELSHTGFSHLELDTVQQLILVGETEHGILHRYDMNGKEVANDPVGFSFLRFAWSPEERRYMFYLPGQTNDAIVITDEKFRILKRLFPLSEEAKQCPYFTSSRFRRSGNAVYYNPSFSPALYKIGFDGSTQVVLELNPLTALQRAAIDSLCQYSGTIEAFYALEKILPINSRFEVTDDVMIIGNVPGVLNSHLIIDRNTMHGLVKHNSMLLANFGPKFMFTYAAPDFSNSRYFYSIMGNTSYNKLLGWVQPPGMMDHLPQKLDPDQLVLLEYMPNKSFINGESTLMEKPSSREITIWPNPASEEITIVPADGETISAIIISTNDGKRVWESQQAVTSQVSLSVSGWTPGMYVATIKTPSGDLSRFFMVK
jgi:hypothetical protein